jgi:hypothetical protein
MEQRCLPTNTVNVYVSWSFVAVSMKQTFKVPFLPTLVPHVYVLYVLTLCKHIYGHPTRDVRECSDTFSPVEATKVSFL